MVNRQYEAARKIQLLVTDCDGVLTDGRVLYSETGEQGRLFNVRDGMAVERLRKLVGVDVSIISGEPSSSIKRRAEKLLIEEVHLGVRTKAEVLTNMAKSRGLHFEQIAYIGDDVNDIEAMQLVGLSLCPHDAVPEVIEIAHYRCLSKGGDGAFREAAELIIKAKL